MEKERYVAKFEVEFEASNKKAAQEIFEFMRKVIRKYVMAHDNELFAQLEKWKRKEG